MMNSKGDFLSNFLSSWTTCDWYGFSYVLKNSKIGVRCVLADRLAVTAVLDGTLLWKPTVNFSVEKRSPRSIFEPISKCSQCTDTLGALLERLPNKPRLAASFAVRNFVVWRRCRGLPSQSLPSKVRKKRLLGWCGRSRCLLCSIFRSRRKKYRTPSAPLFYETIFYLMRFSLASLVALSWF